MKEPQQPEPVDLEQFLVSSGKVRKVYRVPEVWCERCNQEHGPHDSEQGDEKEQ